MSVGPAGNRPPAKVDWSGRVRSHRFGRQSITARRDPRPAQLFVEDGLL